MVRRKVLSVILICSISIQLAGCAGISANSSVYVPQKLAASAKTGPSSRLGGIMNGVGNAAGSAKSSFSGAAGDAKSILNDATGNAKSKLNDVAGNAKSKLNDAANSAKSSAAVGASNAKETLNDAHATLLAWYEKIDFERFEKGWKYAVDFMGTAYSVAQTSQYISGIEDAISQLKSDINLSANSARDIAQEAGFVAEKWTAGTFNIDAALNGSDYSANTVGSNKPGSVDVSTNYGENASLKFYKNAKGSAGAQAQAREVIKTFQKYANSVDDPISFKEFLDNNGYDPETQADLLKAVYDGQTRIIPADQMKEAIAYLNNKIDKLSLSDSEMDAAEAERYKETLKNLKDRLEAPDGTESKPVSYDEMQAITELAQEGKFDPEDFGFKLSDVIEPKYVLKEAMGTGLEVGLIKAAFEIGPDIFSIIVEAVKTGNIDEDELKNIGVDGAIALSQGFVEGSLSSILVTACQEGLLGEALVNAPSNVIGALVVITIDAIINGYALSKGEITAADYGNLMADHILVTLIAMPSTSLLVMLLPGTKFAVLAGCLAGGIIASVGYKMTKDAVLKYADGGGFDAIVPVASNNAEVISIAKSKIKNIGFSKHLTRLKNITVSTSKEGTIRIAAKN